MRAWYSMFVLRAAWGGVKVADEGSRFECVSSIAKRHVTLGRGGCRSGLSSTQSRLYISRPATASSW
eukprot:2326557-Rhodomonas_salina.1